MVLKEISLTENWEILAEKDVTKIYTTADKIFKNEDLDRYEGTIYWMSMYEHTIRTKRPLHRMDFSNWGDSQVCLWIAKEDAPELALYLQPTVYYTEQNNGVKNARH